MGRNYSWSKQGKKYSLEDILLLKLYALRITVDFLAINEWVLSMKMGSKYADWHLPSRSSFLYLAYCWSYC